MMKTRISLVPDAQLRIEIEAEQRRIAQQTGFRPSLSQTTCALIRQALAGRPSTNS